MTRSHHRFVPLLLRAELMVAVSLVVLFGCRDDGTSPRARPHPTTLRAVGVRAAMNWSGFSADVESTTELLDASGSNVSRTLQAPSFHLDESRAEDGGWNAVMTLAPTHSAAAVLVPRGVPAPDVISRIEVSVAGGLPRTTLRSGRTLSATSQALLSKAHSTLWPAEPFLPARPTLPQAPAGSTPRPGTLAGLLVTSESAFTIRAALDKQFGAPQQIAQVDLYMATRGDSSFSIYFDRSVGNISDIRVMVPGSPESSLHYEHSELATRWIGRSMRLLGAIYGKPQYRAANIEVL